MLAGSALWERDAARRVQDPISLRCVSQVHGAALAALGIARDDVEIELNSAADSPLVLAESGEMLSSGNFHIPGLALAFDSLGLSLAHVALLCVMRCQKLYSPALSGLPLQLTTRGPEHSGFATLQKTLTALWNSLRHRANPASLDSLPVSEGVEDHAPMALNVVAKTADMVPDLSRLAAIELLSAAQAIDLRATPMASLGRGAAQASGVIRAHVAKLDEDRPLGPDVETIAALIADGSIPPSTCSRDEWLLNNWDQVAVALWQHVVIAFTSIAIASRSRSPSASGPPAVSACSAGPSASAAFSTRSPRSRSSRC